ncbi:uncharacterized protein LOC113566510 [Drosophila persimilis]|uniref:uncharacterized protein LOC113566510 n=1 Tax=Drosophila persimilis TaxID=7234 RepID=UPI000F0973D2|nr:uncharacterized protein LOC113566510 [Drosophila persimilis]
MVESRYKAPRLLKVKDAKRASELPDIKASVSSQKKRARKAPQVKPSTKLTKETPSKPSAKRTKITEKFKNPTAEGGHRHIIGRHGANPHMSSGNEDTHDAVQFACSSSNCETQRTTRRPSPSITVRTPSRVLETPTPKSEHCRGGALWQNEPALQAAEVSDRGKRY